MVPEGGVLDRVLSSQGDAAEQNEEEDQVGEDRVIDNAVALEAEPARGVGRGEKCQKRRDHGAAPALSLEKVLLAWEWVLSPKAYRWEQLQPCPPLPLAMGTSAQNFKF